MMKMKILENNSESGFTLLETTFVLSVFLLITSISFLLLRPQALQLETKQFFSQLQSDLLFAQVYAITNQETITINFMNDDHFYYVAKQGGKRIIQRNYAKKIKAMEGTQGLYIRFRSNGNISKAGTITFYIEDKRYSLVFQLGRGRFYLAEF